MARQVIRVTSTTLAHLARLACQEELHALEELDA